VDLAGSERQRATEAAGVRLKEASAINKSLSALGDVFGALAAKQAHVPYRNSKLTYLLQPCLGGDGKTLMFVNLAPEATSADESLCALRFAAMVNACELGGKGRGAGAKRNLTAIAPPPQQPQQESSGNSGALGGGGRPSVSSGGRPPAGGARAGPAPGGANKRSAGAAGLSSGRPPLTTAPKVARK
jgi:hypothetical protein